MAQFRFSQASFSLPQRTDQIHTVSVAFVPDALTGTTNPMLERIYVALPYVSAPNQKANYFQNSITTQLLDQLAERAIQQAGAPEMALIDPQKRTYELLSHRELWQAVARPLEYQHIFRSNVRSWFENADWADPAVSQKLAQTIAQNASEALFSQASFVQLPIGSPIEVIVPQELGNAPGFRAFKDALETEFQNLGFEVTVQPGKMPASLDTIANSLFIGEFPVIADQSWFQSDPTQVETKRRELAALQGFGRERILLDLLKAPSTNEETVIVESAAGSGKTTTIQQAVGYNFLIRLFPRELLATSLLLSKFRQSNQPAYQDYYRLLTEQAKTALETNNFQAFTQTLQQLAPHTQALDPNHAAMQNFAAALSGLATTNPNLAAALVNLTRIVNGQIAPSDWAQIQNTNWNLYTDKIAQQLFSSTLHPHIQKQIPTDPALVFDPHAAVDVFLKSNDDPAAKPFGITLYKTGGWFEDRSNLMRQFLGALQAQANQPSTFLLDLATAMGPQPITLSRVRINVEELVKRSVGFLDRIGLGQLAAEWQQVIDAGLLSSVDVAPSSRTFDSFLYWTADKAARAITPLSVLTTTQLQLNQKDDRVELRFQLKTLLSNNNDAAASYQQFYDEQIESLITRANRLNRFQGRLMVLEGTVETVDGRERFFIDTWQETHQFLQRVYTVSKPLETVERPPVDPDALLSALGDTLTALNQLIHSDQLFRQLDALQQTAATIAQSHRGDPTVERLINETLSALLTGGLIDTDPRSGVDSPRQQIVEAFEAALQERATTLTQLLELFTRLAFLLENVTVADPQALDPNQSVFEGLLLRELLQTRPNSESRKRIVATWLSGLIVSKLEPVLEAARSKTQDAFITIAQAIGYTIDPTHLERLLNQEKKLHRLPLTQALLGTSLMMADIYTQHLSHLLNIYPIVDPESEGVSLEQRLNEWRSIATTTTLGAGVDPRTTPFYTQMRALLALAKRQAQINNSPLTIEQPALGGLQDFLQLGARFHLLPFASLIVRHFPLLGGVALPLQIQRWSGDLTQTHEFLVGDVDLDPSHFVNALHYQKKHAALIGALSFTNQSGAVVSQAVQQRIADLTNDPQQRALPYFEATEPIDKTDRFDIETEALSEDAIDSVRFGQWFGLAIGFADYYAYRPIEDIEAIHKVLSNNPSIPSKEMLLQQSFEEYNALSDAAIQARQETLGVFEGFLALQLFRDTQTQQPLLLLVPRSVYGERGHLHRVGLTATRIRNKAQVRNNQVTVREISRIFLAEHKQRLTADEQAPLETILQYYQNQTFGLNAGITSLVEDDLFFLITDLLNLPPRNVVVDVLAQYAFLPLKSYPNLLSLNLPFFFTTKPQVHITPHATPFGRYVRHDVEIPIIADEVQDLGFLNLELMRLSSRLLARRIRQRAYETFEALGRQMSYTSRRQLMRLPLNQVSGQTVRSNVRYARKEAYIGDTKQGLNWRFVSGPPFRAFGGSAEAVRYLAPLRNREGGSSVLSVPTIRHAVRGLSSLHELPALTDQIRIATTEAVKTMRDYMEDLVLTKGWRFVAPMEAIDPIEKERLLYRWRNKELQGRIVRISVVSDSSKAYGSAHIPTTLQVQVSVPTIVQQMDQSVVGFENVYANAPVRFKATEGRAAIYHTIVKAILEAPPIREWTDGQTDSIIHSEEPLAIFFEASPSLGTTVHEEAIKAFATALTQIRAKVKARPEAIHNSPILVLPAQTTALNQQIRNSARYTGLTDKGVIAVTLLAVHSFLSEDTYQRILPFLEIESAWMGEWLNAARQAYQTVGRHFQPTTRPSQTVLVNTYSNADEWRVHASIQHHLAFLVEALKREWNRQNNPTARAGYAEAIHKITQLAMRIHVTNVEQTKGDQEAFVVALRAPKAYGATNHEYVALTRHQVGLIVIDSIPEGMFHQDPVAETLDWLAQVKPDVASKRLFDRFGNELSVYRDGRPRETFGLIGDMSAITGMRTALAVLTNKLFGDPEAYRWSEFLYANTVSSLATLSRKAITRARAAAHYATDNETIFNPYAQSFFFLVGAIQRSNPLIKGERNEALPPLFRYNLRGIMINSQIVPLLKTQSGYYILDTLGTNDWSKRVYKATQESDLIRQRIAPFGVRYLNPFLFKDAIDRKTKTVTLETSNGKRAINAILYDDGFSFQQLKDWIRDELTNFLQAQNLALTARDTSQDFEDQLWAKAEASTGKSFAKLVFRLADWAMAANQAAYDVDSLTEAIFDVIAIDHLRAVQTQTDPVADEEAFEHGYEKYGIQLFEVVRTSPQGVYRALQRQTQYEDVSQADPERVFELLANENGDYFRMLNKFTLQKGGLIELHLGSSLDVFYQYSGTFSSGLYAPMVDVFYSSQENSVRETRFQFGSGMPIAALAYMPNLLKRLHRKRHIAKRRRIRQVLTDLLDAKLSRRNRQALDRLRPSDATHIRTRNNLGIDPIFLLSLIGYQLYQPLLAQAASEAERYKIIRLLQLQIQLILQYSAEVMPEDLLSEQSITDETGAHRTVYQLQRSWLSKAVESANNAWSQLPNQSHSPLLLTYLLEQLGRKPTPSETAPSPSFDEEPEGTAAETIEQIVDQEIDLTTLADEAAALLDLSTLHVQTQTPKQAATLGDLIQALDYYDGLGTMAILFPIATSFNRPPFIYELSLFPTWIRPTLEPHLRVGHLGQTVARNEDYDGDMGFVEDSWTDLNGERALEKYTTDVGQWVLTRNMLEQGETQKYNFFILPDENSGASLSLLFGLGRIITVEQQRFNPDVSEQVVFDFEKNQVMVGNQRFDLILKEAPVLHAGLLEENEGLWISTERSFTLATTSPRRTDAGFLIQQTIADWLTQQGRRSIQPQEFDQGHLLEFNPERRKQSPLYNADYYSAIVAVRIDKNTILYTTLAHVHFLAMHAAKATLEGKPAVVAHILNAAREVGWLATTKEEIQPLDRKHWLAFENAFNKIAINALNVYTKEVIASFHQAMSSPVNLPRNPTRDSNDPELYVKKGRADVATSADPIVKRALEKLQSAQAKIFTFHFMNKAILDALQAFADGFVSWRERMLGEIALHTQNAQDLLRTFLFMDQDFVVIEEQSLPLVQAIERFGLESAMRSFQRLLKFRINPSESAEWKTAFEAAGLRTTYSIREENYPEEYLLIPFPNALVFEETVFMYGVLIRYSDLKLAAVQLRVPKASFDQKRWDGLKILTRSQVRSELEEMPLNEMQETLLGLATNDFHFLLPSLYNTTNEAWSSINPEVRSISEIDDRWASRHFSAHPLAYTYATLETAEAELFDVLEKIVGKDAMTLVLPTKIAIQSTNEIDTSSTATAKRYLAFRQNTTVATNAPVEVNYEYALDDLRDTFKERIGGKSAYYLWYGAKMTLPTLKKPAASFVTEKEPLPYPDIVAPNHMFEFLFTTAPLVHPGSTTHQKASLQVSNRDLSVQTVRSEHLGEDVGKESNTVNAPVVFTVQKDDCGLKKKQSHPSDPSKVYALFELVFTGHYELGQPLQRSVWRKTIINWLIDWIGCAIDFEEIRIIGRFKQDSNVFEGSRRFVPLLGGQQFSGRLKTNDAPALADAILDTIENFIQTEPNFFPYGFALRIREPSQCLLSPEGYLCQKCAPPDMDGNDLPIGSKVKINKNNVQQRIDARKTFTSKKNEPHPYDAQIALIDPTTYLTDTYASGAQLHHIRYHPKLLNPLGGIAFNGSDLPQELIQQSRREIHPFGFWMNAYDYDPHTQKFTLYPNEPSSYEVERTTVLVPTDILTRIKDQDVMKLVHFLQQKHQDALNQIQQAQQAQPQGQQQTRVSAQPIDSINALLSVLAAEITEKTRLFIDNAFESIFSKRTSGYLMLAALVYLIFRLKPVGGGSAQRMIPQHILVLEDENALQRLEELLGPIYQEVAQIPQRNSNPNQQAVLRSQIKPIVFTPNVQEIVNEFVSTVVSDFEYLPKTEHNRRLRQFLEDYPIKAATLLVTDYYLHGMNPQDVEWLQTFKAKPIKPSQPYTIVETRNQPEIAVLKLQKFEADFRNEFLKTLGGVLNSPKQPLNTTLSLVWSGIMNQERFAPGVRSRGGFVFRSSDPRVLKLAFEAVLVKRGAGAIVARGSAVDTVGFRPRGWVSVPKIDR